MAGNKRLEYKYTCSKRQQILLTITSNMNQFLQYLNHSDLTNLESDGRLINTH